MDRISRSFRGKLTDKATAALAMMQTGFTDLSLIAKAVRLPLLKVMEIEQADDLNVRRIVANGIPDDFVYHIHGHVKCRTCGGRINKVPCIVCHQLES